MQAYVDLHEDTSASTAPYGQVAIELEIENLSVRFGLKLIEQAQRLLGPEVMSRLSFVEEHVEIDVGRPFPRRPERTFILKLDERLMNHRFVPRRKWQDFFESIPARSLPKD